MSYARWAKEDEVEKITLKFSLETGVKKMGLPCGYDEKNIKVLENNYHNLVIGSTGSGKTQTTILPMIKMAMMAGETVVVNDPMGYLYKKTAGKLEKEGYKVNVIDINNSKYGNSYNPLKLIYDVYKDGNKDKALEMIDDLGYYLLSDLKETIDPYWSNTAINYFTGMVLYLLENAKEEEINFRSIANVSYKLMDEEFVKDFLKKIDVNSSIYSNLSGTLCTPMETRAGIFSTFNQKFRLVISKESFVNMLSFSDFDMRKIGNEKNALFIIGGDDISDRLTSLIIRQVYTAVDLYGSNRKVNILLDEFSYLMPIRNFYRMLNTSNGLNINFTVVIKSFMDLVNSYGKENTEVLKQSFQNILYLMSNDNYTLEEISKMCGKKEDGSYLVDSEELKHLDNFEAIILTIRSMPIRTKLIPDYEINYGYKEVEKDLPVRENKEIRIFEM